MTDDEEILRIARVPNSDRNQLGYQVQELKEEHILSLSLFHGWHSVGSRKVWRDVGPWYAMKEYAEQEFSGRWEVIQFERNKDERK